MNVGMDAVGRFDPQFLAERSQALQAFLANALVKIPVTTSDSMLNFLEVSCVCAATSRAAECFIGWTWAARYL